MGALGPCQVHWREIQTQVGPEMFNHNFSRRALPMLVASAIFTATAAAQDVEETVFVPLQSTNWVETLSIPKYDDLGGTRLLLSVHLEATMEMVATLQMENLACSQKERSMSTNADRVIQQLFAYAVQSLAAGESSSAVGRKYRR